MKETINHLTHIKTKKKMLIKSFETMIEKKNSKK